MGGCRSKACKRIWDWCISRYIWLTSTQIAGIDSTDADTLSRVFDDQTEWRLDIACYQRIVDYFRCEPKCDLFASRLNYQIANYVSWLPDPGTSAVDAFEVDWQGRLMYALPPFSLMGHVLQKIETDEADVLVIALRWPTQSWYPELIHLLVRHPVLLPYHCSLTTLPFARQRVHPLGRQLNLMACLLSGKSLQEKRVSQRARDIIIKGWRSSTKEQHVSYLRKLGVFSANKGYDPIRALVKGVLDFLAQLFEDSYGYSTVNTTRSALSSIILVDSGQQPVGKHPLVHKFTKGIFNQTPALPRYTHTWDVDTVLRFLLTLSPVRRLSVKNLSLKLVMLIALVSGQRSQT